MSGMTLRYSEYCDRWRIGETKEPFISSEAYSLSTRTSAGEVGAGDGGVATELAELSVLILSLDEEANCADAAMLDACEREFVSLGGVNTGLLCIMGCCVVAKSGSVTCGYLVRSAIVMLVVSRVEGEKYHGSRSRTKGWFEAAKFPNRDEGDSRLDWVASATLPRCSGVSIVVVAEDTAYTHGVPLLAQRVQIGWV